MHTIYITPEDNARLRLLLLLSPYTEVHQRERELLRRELDRAAITPRAIERPEAVRLGVAFDYEDLQSGAIASACLCLPEDAAAVPNGISVLSRFGAAVIGCSVGNEVWWAEADRCRRILIRRISASTASEPEPVTDGAISTSNGLSTEDARIRADEAELQSAS